jgi:hypothetical protein
MQDKWATRELCTAVRLLSDSVNPANACEITRTYTTAIGGSCRKRRILRWCFKGHLLIEEQFDFFLDELSRSPEVLEKARLTFMQKFRLMQSLASLGSRDEVSQFVERVNKLRNKMAHAAEVGALDAMVDDALRAMYQDEFFAPHSARQRATLLRRAFVLAISRIRGHAEGFTVAVKPRKPSEE